MEARMGGAGSGGYDKKEFSDAEIENMRRWRSLGHSWEHISARLGLRSETPIERFRKENPEFDKQVGTTLLNLESALVQDLIKLVRNLCAKDKPPPPELVKMIMQYFKVFEKDAAPLTAIQLNNSNEGGLQINFVNPKDLEKTVDVIDVTKENA
jgi:hypothetical protein